MLKGSAATGGGCHFAAVAWPALRATWTVSDCLPRWAVWARTSSSAGWGQIAAAVAAAAGVAVAVAGVAVVAVVAVAAAGEGRAVGVGGREVCLLSLQVQNFRAHGYYSSSIHCQVNLSCNVKSIFLHE